MDGAHHCSAPDILSPARPLTPGKARADSPRIVARMASGESDDRRTPRKGHTGLRESRSRSRLRNLKFWKKRRDVSAVDAGEAAVSGES